MSLSLPAESPRARSLTRVVPEVLSALDGRAEWLAPATSAILFVVDGLGARSLAARAGHARFLAERGGRKDVARSVFPSTTAAALTSLMTGVDPGQHGLVGYRVRIPGTDLAPNQLKGWETDGLDPYSWQRAQPLLERESARGRPCFVVSRPKFAGSGFTKAILRGAGFVSAKTAAEGAEIAADLAARHPGALVYLYAPELDGIAHQRGWESDEWASGLETVDAAARALSSALAPGVGALFTADHGMIDVPRHRQVLLTEDDPLVDYVRIIGGEPRMLHLYVEPGREASVLQAWRESESSRSWVLSREEAIDAGLFGTVVPEVRERIGDVVVAARASIAYYDDRLDDKGPQNMVGQHGSLTDEERTVPLIRLGAFA
ncbi:alkaline phosphatase family protein [Microbacterium sp. 4R-513]|uniref:alkaline phosphatase family protein n=1 Tax=Microbacterium sp. 4R-513 TaxID=2567934 RepID=UPI0013E105F3|nr:nucleotide pyrophosphatase/phosphodiesterase family protein [Microbacterium sp. 4R-513]QIG40650.1 alkaline phosphatase family protein [Microbacterium sp. 4R-513]